MKKNVFYNTFGNIFYSFCQWLLSIVVVRLAGYESAGILSLAMTTSSSFSAISHFSMRNYQISDSKGEFEQGQYVSSRIITCLAALVCCVVSAVPGNSSYQVFCIFAFMLVRVAEGLVDVLHGIDQKHDKYGYICASYVSRGIFTILSFVLGLMFTHNMAVSLLIMAVLNLLVAILYDVRMTFVLEKIVIKLRDKRVVALLKKCLPLVIISFLLSLENLIPKYFLKVIEGEESLGIYSSMASPTLVVQVFATVAFAPFVPKMAELLKNKEYDGFLKILRLAYVALGVLAVGVIVAASIFGKPVLKILFGESILESYNLFIPIIWCTILLAYVWVFQAVVVTLRKLNILLIGMAVDFIILCCITKPCIYQLGTNGTSIAQIVVMGAMVPFMIILGEADIFKRKKRNNTIEG